MHSYYNYVQSSVFYAYVQFIVHVHKYSTIYMYNIKSKFYLIS